MFWRAVRSAMEVVRKKSSDKSAKLGSRIRRTEISEVDRIGAAREAPGSGSGKLVGGGDVGALDTGVGVCPHLLLTKEAGSVGGCGVRRASKEANRGTCETKRHCGFKCVFKHKVRVQNY